MSIPKHAKRIFKGRIFDIYQWKQKMFDGSFEVFEKIRRPDSVIIIATQKGKLVCLRQKQPNTGWFMCTPSGRMDVPGESPKNAALRELLEETGMIPGKLIPWKKEVLKGKIISTIHFFIARDCVKISAQKLDPGEKIQVKLLSFEQYLKLVDTPISAHWLGESIIDIYKARLDKKFKAKYKKLIFG